MIVFIDELQTHPGRAHMSPSEWTGYSVTHCGKIDPNRDGSSSSIYQSGSPARPSPFGVY